MGKVKSFLAVLGAIFLMLVALSFFKGMFIKEEVIPGEKIALVEIKGIISKSDYYVKTLEDLSKNKNVKAIVIRVDSPGGVVVPCQEIYEEVKRVKSRKPIIVSMGSVAASGGLYISVPATKVVANPGTITGSIGVIFQTFNFKKIADKLGLKVITVKSGKHKDLVNPFKEVDPSDIEIIQDMINDTYSQFVKAISESRHIPEDKVRQIADGRIFTGRKAKELGIVDEIGDLNRAIEIAREISRSPEAKVYRIRKKKSFFEKLFGEEGKTILNSLSTVLEGNVEKAYLMYILN